MSDAMTQTPHVWSTEPSLFVCCMGCGVVKGTERSPWCSKKPPALGPGSIRCSPRGGR